MFMLKRGLLPTPTAVQMESPERTKRAIDLAKQNLPLYTRRIVDGKKVEGARTYTIQAALMHRLTLPTPTAHLAKMTGAPSEFRRNTPSLITNFIEAGLDTGKRPRLHPHFVEWMMGFPIGWTD